MLVATLKQIGIFKQGLVCWQQYLQKCTVLAYYGHTTSSLKYILYLQLKECTPGFFVTSGTTNEYKRR